MPASVPLTGCDRLVQPPKRVFGPLPVPADGVDYAHLRWPAARAACLMAMAEYPDEPRFVAYAGRAADKSGDAAEAARLYRAAAEDGNAMAQNNLAAMFEHGDGGLPRNNREAVRLYRLAAEQGYPAAQASLASFLSGGSGGLARNDAEAVRLWRMAAEAGDANAQYGLGRMYAQGRGGLARDMDEATRLWRMAAEAGNADAADALRKLPADEASRPRPAPARPAGAPANAARP